MEVIPKDWPSDGPIDLAIHDHPHQSSDTEWWYFNGHLKTEENRRFSLFASFFIKRKSINSNEISASALWALSDLNQQKYYAHSCVDKDTPTICLEKMGNLTTKDIPLKKAMEEVFKKNKIPMPDKLIIDNVIISREPFTLKFGDMLFEKHHDETYHLTLLNPKENIKCELIFTPKKNLIRHGENGIVCGINDEHMFYYFIPRCQVDGKIEIENKQLAIVHGQGWYDHEFGVQKNKEIQLDAKNSWIWMCIQLSNGYDISIYCINDVATVALKSLFCIVIDPSGKAQHFDQLTLEPTSNWKSTNTFSEFHVAFKLSVPDAKLFLEINASMMHQEFITLLSYPSFWEGCCTVNGDHQGKSVTGLSFVEQTNRHPIKSVKDFFNSVSLEVTNEIQHLLPLSPNYDKILNLIASTNNKHLLNGVDLQQIIKTIIVPIRTICDRAGKRWRSYALVAGCNLVGGNFAKYKEWLAIPELIHTGSLIIDDVEDQSSIRRGGPSCHILFGEPHAINAGTAAYGLFHVILQQSDLHAADRCKVYELYFDTFRAAHAGQAIDLDGHLDCLTESIKNNNYKQLHERVLASHRLKSGVPAASLARMGGILGNGNEVQIQKLGDFFETLGVAFQIVDDVLNLRGFKQNLKTKGEDILNGKVTYPIVKSLELLKLDEINWMWNVLSSQIKKTNELEVLIYKLESSGALSACYEDAQSMIDAAWMEIDGHFEESFTKTMLRAFSWYVIDRHY